MDALPDISAELRTFALSLGFVRVGVASAEPLGDEGAKLRAWIAKGFHGDMGYMASTATVRADPTHPGMLPSAVSIIALATPYAHPTRMATGNDNIPKGKIARYAQGRDYHNVLYKRTRKIARWLGDRGFAARCAVDSMPVFERAWAERAGIGFIGKNCCLIIPGIGSHVFLSAIVTSAPLLADSPMRSRCGKCTACLTACPTQAFVAPNTMDARKCIAYLTIEHRGHIDESLKPKMGEWLFGCDICQDVCPFNKAKGAHEGDSAFAPLDAIQKTSASDWLSMTEPEFNTRTQGTALRRASYHQMKRNALIVLNNQAHDPPSQPHEITNKI